MNKLEERVQDIAFVETEKGSRYEYLSDGRTQRVQVATGTTHEPQDLLVFIPDYHTVMRTAPKALLQRNVFGENEVQYNQLILSYVQEPEKTLRIAKRSGKVIDSNEQALQTKEQVVAAFINKASETCDFTIPISTTPIVGYLTFDQRWVSKEKGLKEYHIGNKVTGITFAG